MTPQRDDEQDDRRMFQRRETERDDAIEGSPVRVKWQFLAWALGIIITGLMTYNATANTMNARVSVLESQRNEMKEQIDRMNNKLDRLLELAQGRRP